MPFVLVHVLAVAALAELPAAVPAEKFNLNVQHRTRSCVEMKGNLVPLRFTDGTPTGFFAHADDPSKQGSADPCPVGTMEIDAHETLKTADGTAMYFHPGGGPDQYNNYIETGQYGHIALDDLTGRAKLIPTPNGKRAPARAESARTYYVTPTRIPFESWYKPNVVDGKSGSRYFTYGNPGYDKTYGRGDWTYISWSWVQVGGHKYPANKQDGGGIARAVLKRGMRLTACDVEPIFGVSYGPDNQINGRVTAFYARTYCGPGEQGSPIHGWLPHSYQMNGQLIVPCVRRTGDAPERAMPASSLNSRDDDRMNRMAVNLLFELEMDDATAKRARAYWARKYIDEKDAFARMEILSEMSRLDQPKTVTLLLQAMEHEQDPRVREQAVVLLGYMRSTEGAIERVCQTMRKLFGKTDDEGERLRMLEILSNLPCPQTVAFVRDVVPLLGTGVDNVELQIAAADAVLKLSWQTPVDEALAKAVLEPLQRHAAEASSRGLRVRVIRLLAAPGRDQLSFLVGLLEAERSPRTREVITTVTENLRRFQEYSASP